VLVVSSNPETLDGLTQYFSQAGVPSQSRRTANPLADLPASLCALVVFPDDFPEHEVSSYLFVARTRRPDMTMVLVTRDPHTYTRLTTTDGQLLNAVVLARPAFGWTILDVIRSARETTAAL
jgi:UDP-N-acetylmuramate-alanine ligase